MEIPNSSSAIQQHALVDFQLDQLLRAGHVEFETIHIGEHQGEGTEMCPFVQPASVDLPLSSSAYLVSERVLPVRHTVEDLISTRKLDTLDLDAENGALFLRGHVYLVPVANVRLPDGLSAMLSPKSSIGRIDLMVRAMVDGCGLYDTVPESHDGRLWLEITPRSFNVRLKSGQCLSQMMVFRSKRHDNVSAGVQQIVSLPDLGALVYDDHGNALQPVLHKGMSLVLTLRVLGDMVGYEAVATNSVIDISKIRGHASSDFFRPLMANHTDSRSSEGAEDGGCVTLVKDRFYILCTRERIRVPPEWSAEMVPFSHHIGELRAHFAGFFDPGFGDPNGTVGVLEVRPHETLTVYHGQPICLMDFYPNEHVPQRPYGHAGLRSHYQQQRGPTLAKFFSDASNE